MCAIKEYIDSFINDINQEINWNQLKSRKQLKKIIHDLVFQIDFYSSKFNNMDSHIEIRSECRIWYKKYDKSLTVNSSIANIAFLEENGYWWDITGKDKREIVLRSIIGEIKAKVIPVTDELENNFNNGLLQLIYSYGFIPYNNSIQLIDELAGREEAIKAANEYSNKFTKAEKNLIKRFLNGEINLVNEKNLRYIIDNHLINP